jgi:hypothetical protein
MRSARSSTLLLSHLGRKKLGLKLLTKLNARGFMIIASIIAIGGWCLPYAGKGSTIDEIVEWFDKEIWALLGAITKANQNFLCYCLVGVLRMLYENADCDHLDWLEAIMNSYDASLLNGRPDEIAKLLGCIVRKWWSSHGLPYVMDIFCVVPEVRLFITCCDV